MGAAGHPRHGPATEFRKNLDFHKLQSRAVWAVLYLGGMQNPRLWKPIPPTTDKGAWCFISADTQHHMNNTFSDGLSSAEHSGIRYVSIGDFGATEQAPPLAGIREYATQSGQGMELARQNKILQNQLEALQAEVCLKWFVAHSKDQTRNFYSQVIRLQRVLQSYEQSESYNQLTYKTKYPQMARMVRISV